MNYLTSLLRDATDRIYLAWAAWCDRQNARLMEAVERDLIKRELYDAIERTADTDDEETERAF